MDHTPPRYPVTCTIDGKMYKAHYWIAGKILTVATGLGGKSRQVGAGSPQTVAEELLKQLVRDGKA